LDTPTKWQDMFYIDYWEANHIYCIYSVWNGKLVCNNGLRTNVRAEKKAEEMYRRYMENIDGILLGG